MLQNTIRQTRRFARSNTARIMCETLEVRALMSAAPTLIASAPAPVQAAPAVTVQAQPTNPSQPALQQASVREGVDNNGNLVVVAFAANNGQPTAPAYVNVFMYHDNRGAEISISANGQTVTLPTSNFGNSITVTDTTGGTINFAAYDTQLLSDYVPSINLTSNNGTVDVTSVVPVMATGYNVNQGDTGTFNARSTLTGSNTAISQPGGATLIASGQNTFLASYGPIQSMFYGNGGGTTIVDGSADSTAYVGSGDVAIMGAGNDTVHINAYGGWGNGSNYTYVDTGAGNDTVDVNGSATSLVRVFSSGNAYVQQLTPLGHLSVGNYGGWSTLARDVSLQSDSNYDIFGYVNVYYSLLNNGIIGGKG